MGMILKTKIVEHKVKYIRCMIIQSLDLWGIGKYSALYLDIIEESWSWPTQTTRDNDETEARTFNTNIVNGIIRASFRCIQGHWQGGVLFLGVVDTNNRWPVMEVLR